MRKDIWDQLKNITAGELKRALDKDTGWYADETGSSAVIYRNDINHKMVSVHLKTFGRNQLRLLIEATGWTETDLRRLKLVK
jgi:hypothetical protein